MTENALIRKDQGVFACVASGGDTLDQWSE